MSAEALEGLTREELIGLVLSQAEAIGLLEARNTMLEKRVAQLEERVGQNSRNTSKPPSSDGPGAAAEGKRGRGRPRKVRRGGQPGHAGHSRSLLPIEKVDRVVLCREDACERCKAPLSGEDPKPIRHQVHEIPPQRLEVVEYQVHRLRCLVCGHTTSGKPPPGVTSSRFGPRVHALVALLTGRLLLSKREVVEYFEMLYGDGPSAGTVSAIERRMSAMLRAPVRAVILAVRAAGIVYADETKWRQEKKSVWLWEAGAGTGLVFFKIQLGRGRLEAKRLLGKNFGGLAVVDMLGAYNWIVLRQLCWAHVLRIFRALAERKGSEWHGRRLELAGYRVLADWRAWRDGKISREEMFTRITVHRTTIHALLERVADAGLSERSCRQCAWLLKREHLLWTFLDHKDVEPTNNRAERRVRRGVLMRKKTFGTDSVHGSRFVERILTATGCLREQKRDVLAFLTDAYTAHLAGLPMPSLLPLPS